MGKDLEAGAPTRERNEDEVRPFNPHRSAKSDAARALVRKIAEDLRANERRQRTPKQRDQEMFLATIEALIADVTHLTLSAVAGAPTWITVTRSDGLLARLSPQYRAVALNGKLPDYLDALQRRGWIIQRMGDRSAYALVFTDKPGKMRERRMTTIRAGSRLLAEIGRPALSFFDFERDAGPLIVLKRGGDDWWEDSKPVGYADTALTERYKRELGAINKKLAKIRIALIERAPGELACFDTRDRRLYRGFTQGSFFRGGRLWGGFWMNLGSAERLRCLLIDDERVASIDFSSLNARLLYAKESISPPEGDLYLMPGLEPWRQGMKRLFNARLFDKGPRRSKPRRSRTEVRDDVDLFPPDRTIQHLVSALEAAHKPVAHYFGTGIGHELQFQESSILVRALIALGRAGISALPIHDCVLVPRSKVEEAKAIMSEVSEAVVGTAIPVTVEGLEDVGTT